MTFFYSFDPFSQVNRDAKHFYDCWDLMTLTVITGLLCLLEEITTEQGIDIEDINEAGFVQLVDEIFNRCNLLGKWTEEPSWGRKDFSSDELLMLSLGLYCTFFVLIIMIYQHRSALVWCPAVGRKAGDQLWRRRIPDFVHARCNRRISPTGKGDLLVIFMIVCCGLIWCILEYIGILR